MTRSKTIPLDSVLALPTLARSHWFKEAGLQPLNARMLAGHHSADVAIVGGGFVGLWTAIAVKKLKPAAKVVILERDVCGGGASGRNGGFAMSWWPKISSLLRFCDPREAIRLACESQEAIGEIQRFCHEHGVDAHFKQGGWIWTSTNEAQRDAWQGTVDACRRLGHSPFQELTPDEVAGRTGSPYHQAGVIEQSNATVQPAFLVQGLRRTATQLGVQIYENTPVTAIGTGAPALLSTPQGEVSASAVVLASNAWAADIPELRSLITPVSSAIVVTEPLGTRLAHIGWSGGEAITDSQLMVGYYRTTRDGRIVYGKGTGAISRDSQVSEIFSRDPSAERLAVEDFRRAYPSLGHVKLVDSWTGPIDRTYDSLPVFGSLRLADHIFYGIGWSGNGVAPSYLGSKILSALALGIRNEWSQSALVNRDCQKFPPEPIRYFGGNIVRNAVLRKERAEADKRPPRWLDVRLAALAPSGLEDKS